MPAEPLPLRDIHLPEPVSWWPPAPGWWLLLISAVVIIMSVFLLKRIRRRGRLKRTVRNQLGLLREHYHQHHDRVQLVKALSTLMRRASISFYPREDSASLTGERWLQHLDETAPRKEFQHGSGRILASAPYLPASSEIDTDIDDLLSLCENWLKKQPVRAKKP
ncbi:MAG: DUF4381 domain-containing protein [Gammaproteobacteria bacterium]